MHLATNLGLIVFCWGDENNSKETIKFLKQLHIHGIIYDKMDKLSEKTEKVRLTTISLVFFRDFSDFFYSLQFENDNHFVVGHQQRSIFYVDGKESQKDILRLRQLEQPRHENGSPSTSFGEQITPDSDQSSTSRFNSDLNGFSPGVAVQNQQ